MPRWIILAFAFALSLGLFLPKGAGAQTFAVGSRVRVTAGVYARSDTLGLGTKVLRVAGDRGTILRGPAGSSTAWGLSWFVHYDTAPDGWSTQLYLVLDTTTVPPPPPPPPPPSSVAALPRVTALKNLAPSVGFTVGSSFGMAAIPVDSAGDLLGNLVTWTSGDSTLVEVHQHFAGLSQGADLTGLKVGTTVVTASVGAVKATTTVTVLPADTTPAPPIRVNFFGTMQTVFPGKHVYLLPDSLGHPLAHAYVTLVVP